MVGTSPPNGIRVFDSPNGGQAHHNQHRRTLLERSHSACMVRFHVVDNVLRTQGKWTMSLTVRVHD